MHRDRHAGRFPCTSRLRSQVMTASCSTPSLINDITLAIDSVVHFPTRTACVHVPAQGHTGTQRVH
eukprot:4201783-Pleurochrysis_carterae.AAC.1